MPFSFTHVTRARNTWGWNLDMIFHEQIIPRLQYTCIYIHSNMYIRDNLANWVKELDNAVDSLVPVIYNRYVANFLTLGAPGSLLEMICFVLEFYGVWAGFPSSWIRQGILLKIHCSAPCSKRVETDYIERRTQWHLLGLCFDLWSPHGHRANANNFWTACRMDVGHLWMERGREKCE